MVLLHWGFDIGICIILSLVLCPEITSSNGRNFYSLLMMPSYSANINIGVLCNFYRLMAGGMKMRLQ